MIFYPNVKRLEILLTHTSDILEQDEFSCGCEGVADVLLVAASDSIRGIKGRLYYHVIIALS